MFFRSITQSLSMQVSLLLFLVCPLIGVFAGGGFYSLKYMEREVEKRMQKDIELIARAIRGPLEYALEHGRSGSLGQTVTSVFRFGEVYGAYVYDKEGKRIASSGDRDLMVASDKFDQLASEGARKGGYEGSGERQVYSYFVPLADSVGRNIGLLQLVRERNDFHAYIQRVRNQILGLMILILFPLLGVVVYGHHRVIGRHLGRLVESMAHIEGGAHDHRPVPSGPRELRQLAEGMKTMLDSIERVGLEIELKRKEQERLERRLQQSQKMAAIGQLAAGVAHELGTPLSVISGKAQRMLRKEYLPTHVVKVFHETRDAVQRMERIVRQLLDFGRDNQLRLRPVAIDDMVECVVAQISDEVHAQSIQLTISGSRPAPVHCFDTVRMEQALVNLLRNAFHATGSGGKVRVGWFDDGRYLGLFVADNGSGIPREQYSKVFEPFYTTKMVGKGTGLGLAIAQAAVSDHGGRIEVAESELGGALFTILFGKGEDMMRSLDRSTFVLTSPKGGG